MNEPAGPGSPRALNVTGLTVLFEPKEPSVDIVFVHGFTGHPARTWTCKKGDLPTADGDVEDEDGFELLVPDSRSQRFSLFSKPSAAKGAKSKTAHVCWPRDLLPVSIPHARVLTYGYDTNMRHILGPPLSRNTVYDIAKDLLFVLEADRRHEPSRRLLFVAHSLGGIVVKEMLRQASCQTDLDLRKVFDSTTGIVFFGTPHGGADPRGFVQHVAETMIRIAGFSANKQIVNTLLPSSERLKELRDEFGPLAHTQQWTIHSFQESIGIKVLEGRKVVDDNSSCLHSPSVERTQYIVRDHMDMCRFTGLGDIEYTKVVAALDRILSREPLSSGQPKPKKGKSLTSDELKVLVDSLRFGQLDSRHMSIKNAHDKTCRWFLDRSDYRDWLDDGKLSEHHGFFYIRGKPGAGKSTLMKFLVAHSRKSIGDKILLQFFFHARGTDLEQSTTGMYRSLLLQLLNRLPQPEVIFEALGYSSWNSGGNHEWHVEPLKDLFEEAIRRLGRASVVCFIDAIDECDEDQVRDMVTFLHRLGDIAISSGTHLRILFSSRHYPTITIPTGISMTLEGQEGHDQDIVTYIDGRLRIGRTALDQQIRTRLLDKAAGVFMWVVLVVDMLNKERDRGRTGRRLQKMLEDIPGDLHKLFSDILTRDGGNTDELRFCIQWVLFAQRPLGPEELYFAIIAGTEPDELSKWDPQETSPDAIRKFILSASMGLTEVTNSDPPTVQFIHESVRDFLLGADGLREVWPDSIGRNGDRQGQSHQRLAECCIEYINKISADNYFLDSHLPQITLLTKERRLEIKMYYPFLEFSITGKQASIEKYFSRNFHLRPGGGFTTCSEAFQSDIIPTTLACCICWPSKTQQLLSGHTRTANLVWTPARSNMAHHTLLHCAEIPQKPPSFSLRPRQGHFHAGLRPMRICATTISSTPGSSFPVALASYYTSQRLETRPLSACSLHATSTLVG
ncbi:hypothetical protein B0T24DRAFT_5660 [Lasiosphaeria ovina]|uniref:Nephrocystin 3-like N-terminal domain-containing protein n=1 Tax=Lasiosphaeria ovina TaxID=92902 RepID=A0AAE0NIX8_9PEZI|nr:hypothetical protein B0T24DRAFT_5660 [Lasiosphaeria ovina]